MANVFSQRGDDEARNLLAQHNVDLVGLHLIAASQFSAVQKRALVETRIPLDSATDQELRAAIILAGTGKAPEHLFSSKHTNLVALGQLNFHGVPSVSKYSIWALSELKMGFSSLLLPASSLEAQPPEVRKWFLRLLFGDEVALQKNIDLIKHGQTDSCKDVRQEAAMALRETFVPDAIGPICSWFLSEADTETRLALLEHMAAQASRSETYHAMVTEFYRQSRLNSEMRTRLEAAASATPIYRELRKIAIDDESFGLFSETRTLGNHSMTTVNQTFHNSQVGAVSGSGDISSEVISAVSNMDSSQQKDVLLKALATISQLSDVRSKVEGQAFISEVAKSGKRSAWTKLVQFLTQLQSGTTATAGTIEGVDKLIQAIGQLNLPG